MVAPILALRPRRDPARVHASGSGDPLICLPGGPMQDSAYLGDLGGLDAGRTLIRLDLRGTGASAVPEDPASYRCDRLVEDVEALRAHLGLDTVDLLGHSAGANLAALYAARYPERVARLVLLTPGTAAVGLETAGRSGSPRRGCGPGSRGSRRPTRPWRT
ncbi:2-succinyl-6-hydroxy-2,4-cyclohexadiene-1-carboxylate synthase [Streptomyces tanashiensis]